MPRDLTTEFETDRVGMAHILACSHNHINKLVSKGMPRRSRGRYDIADCVQWMLSDVTTRAGIDPEQVEDVVQARTDLYVEQRLKTRVDRRRLEGELVPASEVTDALLRLVAILVAAFEGLPMRAAQEIVGVTSTPVAVGILRAHCNEYRSELAKTFSSLANELGTVVADHIAAADANGGGMGGRGEASTAGEPSPRAMAD